jgi:alpha-tubulin suppressor-like RCC1 family protein
MVNFTNFLSAETFQEGDFFIGYRGTDEVRWPFTSVGTSSPPVTDTPSPSPNTGGSDSNFFILGDGTIRFVGKNSFGHGGLGAGKASASDVITFPRQPAFDPPLLPQEKIVKVYIQVTSSFVITDLGNVYGCGKNTDYQLGTGDAVNKGVFTKILKTTPDTSSAIYVGSGDKVKALSLGSGANGADLTIFARTEMGSVFVWGYNGKTVQRAGIGNTIDEYIKIPTKIATMPNGSDKIVQIAGAGNNKNVVHYVRTQAGKVYSIGESSSGAVGSGSFTSDRTTFTEPVGLPSGYVASDVVVGGEAGNLSTWVIMADGSVYATGINNSSQVTNTAGVAKQHTFAKHPLLAGVSKIVVHADSAATTIWTMNQTGTMPNGTTPIYGQAKGWGNNTRGQLGLGTTATTVTTPTNNASWPFSAGILDMVVGGNDSNKITVIIDRNYNVWAAGYNATGLCGNGTTSTSQPNFVRVLVNPNAGKPKKLLSCANGVNNGSGVPKACMFLLLDTGRLLAWGYDHPTAGQLGIDSSPTSCDIPSFVLITH